MPYFHVVFTLPHELNALIRLNARSLYGALFAAAAQTLQAFARNPRWLNGELGFSLVLHTWSQTLSHHPHVHGLVSGGALRADGHWQPAKSGFLFPVQALARVFRGKYLDALNALRDQRAWQLPAQLAASAPGTISSARCDRHRGSSISRRRSPARRRFCSTSLATPIASPSATSGWSTSMQIP